MLDLSRKRAVAQPPAEAKGSSAPAGPAAAAASRLLPVRAAGLGLSIGGKTLVDDVDVEFATSSISVIMGPNGAGKSLLVRMLHGLIEPTSGTITYGGQPIDEAARLRQAMVFQHPVLLRRSVADNIDFVLKLRGESTPGRRAELLARVKLESHAAQPARKLSGGEQQRLALARALATRPEVLFLDEPTASLDPASVLLIERIVTEAHRSGCKIILITHDLGQARRLAGDVVFLNRGKLLEHRPAAQFFAEPSSAAARDYLAGRIVL